MKLIQRINEDTELVQEQMDKQETAKMAFKIMTKVFDDVEDSLDRLERAERHMKKIGLTEEYRRIVELLKKTYTEFEDFLPGLEMDVRGE